MACSPTCGKYISVFEETTKHSENDQNPDVILSREGPELELKAEVTEQRHNGTPSSALDEDITVFKRVSFDLKAVSSQATARENIIAGSKDREMRRRLAALARTNEYFVPKNGIDREVITADICRYLGNDALVRPGNYEVGCRRAEISPLRASTKLTPPQNPQTRQIQQGYFITAYRNLTTVISHPHLHLLQDPH
jgi:hypothetical protein